MFDSKLQVEDNDGFPFTLLRSLSYDSDILGRTVVVPAGFQTDYASIPWLLWGPLPPVGRYDRAAVIHDYLYRFNGCSRKEADLTLLEAMRWLDVNKLQRAAIYAGVRAGGWHAWRKYRHAN